MNKPEQLETYDNVVAMNVDIQNDFCPGGSLAVTGGDEVIAPMNQINRWTRQQNGLVIFTRDWHPPVTTHFDKWPVHCVQNRAGAAFHDDLEIVNGTGQFDDLDHDLIVSKGMGANEDGYSGFDSVARMNTYDSHGVGGVGAARMDRILTGLLRGDYYETVEPGHKHFPAAEADSLAIVVGGLATDYCVRATVLDALKFQENQQKNQAKKIGVFLLKDAVRSVDMQPGDGDSALKEMEKAGATVTTSEEVLSGAAFQLRSQS